MRSTAPLPSCFRTSTIRPRVRTRSWVPCSSEVMRRPEMESSSFSPVSFMKSATATVGRPPGICRSQMRQVAKPATARPTTRNAVPTDASLRRRRGRSTSRRAERSSESQERPSLGLAPGSSDSAAAITFATGRGTPASFGDPTVAGTGAFGASHISSVSGSARLRPRRWRRRPLHRPLPGEHLPQHHPRRPDVRPLVDDRPRRLLRRHVRRRPGAARPLGPEQVRQAEVEQLHPPVLADEDVGRLQIPVQHAP